MTEQEIAPEDRSTTASGWHPVNIAHLVLGTALLGLFTVWALISSDTVDLEDAHWLLPLPWLVAGVLGLGATVLRNVGRRPGKMSGWI